MSSQEQNVRDKVKLGLIIKEMDNLEHQCHLLTDRLQRKRTEYWAILDKIAKETGKKITVKELMLLHEIQ